jgi:PAS domain S-box-containing protein
MTGAATPIRDAFSRRGMHLRLLAWALALLVLGLAVGYLQLTLREIEAEALKQQDLYSRVLEGQTGGTLDAITVALHATAETLEARMASSDPVDLSTFLAETIEKQAVLRSLSLLDTSGRVIASTNPDNVDLNVDLDLLGGFPKDRLQVFGSLLSVRDLSQLSSVTAQPKGLAVVPLVRRVQRSGQSALVLVALLNPDRFASQQEVLVGENVAARSALFSYDGQLLFGGDKVPLEPGTRPADVTPFTRFLPMREHGSYVGRGLDGRPAVGAFRTVRNWPFVVVSEQSYAELWADLAEHAPWTVFAVALGWLAIGTVAFAVRRGLVNERRAQAQLELLHDKVSRNEERWKLALAGAGDGVWDWDIAEGLVHYSPRAKVMLGISDADGHARHAGWTHFLHPDDAQRVCAQFEAHLDGRQSVLRAEARMRSSDGGWRWLQIRGAIAPERDETDRPNRVIGTLTDVNERHEAEAALAGSQARRIAITQSSLDAIMSIDGDGRIVDFNPAAEAMFGRLQDTVLGQPMHELLIAPHQRAAHLAGVAHYRSTGHGPLMNRRTEMVAMHADGSLFSAELTIVPVYAGEEEMFTATMRDISERRRWEDALRESEARARATFEQAAVGVIQQGADLRILRVNQTLCLLLGYSSEELIALAAEEFVFPDDIGPGRVGLQQLLSGGATNFVQEKRYRRKDGCYIWVRLTASAAHDETGQARFVIGIVEDIGARRQAQEDLAAARRRELQIGARIQQSLLVTAPIHALPGVLLSSHSHASQDIDGDFFEVMQPGNHCLDLIAGDVMGKGVNAALMGAAVKMQFSRSWVELLTKSTAGEIPQPEDILEAVHKAMTPHLQALEAFVTLCYLRIDLHTGTLRWVGCGHEEPVLVRSDGTLVLLHNQQPPLGVLSDSHFEQETIPLRAGDALLMHSDGVSDAFFANGERVGHERVQQAFGRFARSQKSPSALLQLLRRELLAKVTLPDDVTIVVACIGEPEATTQSLELMPTSSSIPALRAFIESEAKASKLGEVEAGLFAVAVVEVFTNVLRHGLGRIEDAPVEILMRRTAEELIVEVIHVGDTFTPPNERPSSGLDGYPEGGFGLSIIARACDKVEYLHSGGVNTTRLERRISRGAAFPLGLMRHGVPSAL